MSLNATITEDTKHFLFSACVRFPLDFQCIFVVVLIIIIIIIIATCLLGATLCTGRALDKALSSRCSDLRIASGRLKVLPSHDALILLRSMFSVPRLMHTLRCVPCAEHSSLTVFDNLSREGISSITNSLLSDIQ